MKFSVITPCYNSESLLDDTIKSIVLQKGDFEVQYIIVDGDSKDGTRHIVNKYVQLIKDKSFLISCNNITITYIAEADDGMYDALSKGFSLATGDVISYINAGDFYSLHAFSVIKDFFMQYNYKWVTGYSCSYNKYSQLTNCCLPFAYINSLIRKGLYGSILPFIQQESTFFKKELLETIDLNLLKKFKYAGDFYLWYCFSCTEKLYIIQAYLGGFKYHDNQLSSNSIDYKKEMMQISSGNKPNIAEVVLAYAIKYLWLILPQKIKKKLNNKGIYQFCYNHDKWK